MNDPNYVIGVIDGMLRIAALDSTNRPRIIHEIRNVIKGYTDYYKQEDDWLKGKSEDQGTTET